MGTRPDQWQPRQWQDPYPYDPHDPYDGEEVLTPSSIYAPGVPIDQPPGDGFPGNGAAPGRDDNSAAAGYGAASAYQEPGYGYGAAPGYPEPGYGYGAAPGYPEPGYPEPGYPEPGYPEPGYPEPGYAEPGYPYPAPGVPGYGVPGDGSVPRGARAPGGNGWRESPVPGGYPPGDSRYPGDSGPEAIVDHGIPPYTDDFGAGAGYGAAGYGAAGYDAGRYDPAGYAASPGQPAAPGYDAAGYGPGGHANGVPGYGYHRPGGHAEPPGYLRRDEYEETAGGYAPVTPGRGQRAARPGPEPASPSPQAQPYPPAQPLPRTQSYPGAEPLRQASALQLTQPLPQLQPSAPPASREPSPAFAYHDDGDAAEPARPQARGGAGRSAMDWYDAPLTEEEQRRRKASEELRHARGAFEPALPPLERIKNLYRAAEAAGGMDPDANFAELMAMQKELISEYFQLSEVNRPW